MPGASTPPIALLGSRKALPTLRRQGRVVVPFRSTEGFLRSPEANSAPLVVLAADASAPERLLAALRTLRRDAPLAARVAWIPEAPARVALEATRAGAAEVVLSPDPAELARVVDRVLADRVPVPELQALDRARRRSQRFEGLISRSPRMWDLFELCVRVAPTQASVLLLGETGTGKELLARALHRRSGRKGRFVAINCAAVPEGLIDAELFGHEKGSFTGAVGRRAGLFQHADGGTLFLDEIADIPLAVQFRLLRVLQEGTVRTLGGREEAEVDVRVVAATSQDLDRRVTSGAFREDLLYRLDVIRMPVPPLRERPEDVVLLFEHFLKRLARTHELARPDVDQGFLDAMVAHPWPGNVRELENFAERLLLTRPGGRLARRHFRQLARRVGTGEETTGRAEEALARVPLDLRRTLKENLDSVTAALEKRYLEELLARNEGKVGETAVQAGMSRRTLQRTMNRLGLRRADFRRSRR